jgi:7-carboxy-7-deazaguanine synthase
MPAGQLSEERLWVDPDDYTAIDALPLVKTGCDSYASWDPRFKRFATTTDIDGVVIDLLSITPRSQWEEIHLVVTGGEPMLWQRIYTPLFKDPMMSSLKHMTFETNTTQPLRWNDFFAGTDRPWITWSCSPKLSASGEKWSDAINPEIAKEYFAVQKSDMYFKFVIDNEEGIYEVLEAVEAYRSAGVECPVYVMPVGGCYEDYSFNSRHVADLAMKYGLKYSPRLHSDLFGNAWGT